MAESKSTYFALSLNADSEKQRDLTDSPINELADISE
jgi:hypothetical protein